MQPAQLVQSRHGDSLAALAHQRTARRQVTLRAHEAAARAGRGAVAPRRQGPLARHRPRAREPRSTVQPRHAVWHSKRVREGHQGLHDGAHHAGHHA